MGREAADGPALGLKGTQVFEGDALGASSRLTTCAAGRCGAMPGSCSTVVTFTNGMAIASGFAHGTAVDPEYCVRSLGGEAGATATLYPVAEREVVGLRDMASLPLSEVVGCAHHGWDYVITFVVHYEHPDNLPCGRSRLFRWSHVIPRLRHHGHERPIPVERYPRMRPDQAVIDAYSKRQPELLTW
jgi:hypothetical protein